MLSLTVLNAPPLPTGSVTNTTFGSGPLFTNTITFSGGALADVNVAPLIPTTTGTSVIPESIGSLTLTSGSGYTAPVATIDDTVGINANAVVSGAVTGITIGTTGSGYTSAPTVTFTSATGSGATGVAVMTQLPTVPVTFEVTGITIISGGAGYVTAPTVVFSGGGGSGATATATLSVTAVNVVPGAVLTSTTLSFVQPAAGGAVTAHVASNISLSVGQTVFIVGGGNYTVATITGLTTISLTNSGIAGNAAVGATVPSNHNVESFGGSGYTANTSVTITDSTGTGSGATAIANIATLPGAPGSIGSFTVTSGSGYIMALTVTFSAPACGDLRRHDGHRHRGLQRSRPGDRDHHHQSGIRLL